MSDSFQIMNLMVIDDDEIEHFLYERIIKRSNLFNESVFFNSAEEALAYLKRPDRLDIRVILLDVNMPRMNGFEFLEAVTQEIGVESLGAAVIMLSSSLNPSDQSRASSYALVKGYLAKPISDEQLVKVCGLAHG